MSKSWVVIAVLLSAMIAAIVAHHKVTGMEREIHVTLKCSAFEVSAMVNGKTLLNRKLGELGISGNRIGLYLFRSFDTPDGKTRFRNLRVHSSSEPPLHLPLLKREAFETNFEISPGWRIQPEEGLRFVDAPGSRGVCLLKTLAPPEFVLEVDILRPVDVGVFFAASDTENGLVLILRPFLNDIFFTSLKAGKPGPIVEIAPLTQLNTRNEALRLAGLIGNLIVKNALFLALLWWIARKIASFASVGVSRMGEIFTNVLSLGSLPLVLFFSTLLALAAVARYFLDAVPHIADESVYFFQAKIFAAGHLWAPAPLYPDFFAFEHMIVENGKWFGKYPPLFPLLLSIGVRAGVPWMVNPLIGALSGLTLFFLTTRITGSRGSGLLAWLLLLTSPFFLLLNAGMMAHGLALLLTLLFIHLGWKGLEQNKASWAALSGLCMGGLILTRPFTAFLVFIPVTLYIVILNVQKHRFMGCLKYMAAMAMGIVPVLLLSVLWHKLYLPENRHFLDFLYSSYNVTDTLGFGADKGKGWLKTWGSWGHTPAKGFRSIYNYLSYTAQHLFGWPLGLSFAFVGIPLFFGRRKAVCGILFSTFCFLVVGHMFYWATQHLGYGARYWFSGMAGLLVPTALGIKLFRDDAAGTSLEDPARKQRVSFFMVLVLMGLTAWNLALYLPQRLEEAHCYGNVSAKLENAAKDLHLEHSLVFVKTENLQYNDGFFMNDPFMKAGVIFARDLGEKNQILMNQYPEYDIYLWDKEGLTQVFKNNHPRNGRTD